ncbi:MAG TPA: alpha/beta fold hydrolase [Burkholderiales bacterium]|nr:alpha/beta fold hydrolase [Burkholderiales bacterium]
MKRLLVFLLALAAAGAAAAVTIDTRPFTLADEATEVDVYLPSALPPRGLAVIAHGFTRSRGRHGMLAARLAEEGFAVAVPDLPHWVRHDANADAIVALVEAVAAQHALDARPVVLIGASAGGLAALLATDRVPRLALWIGLDPVDTFGISEGAARNLQAPALVLRAPSGPCNIGGSARRIAAWLPKRRTERIDGASHCDFEDTTNWRCESVCGPADAARQALIVDAAVNAVREAVPR